MVMRTPESSGCRSLADCRRSAPLVSAGDELPFHYLPRLSAINTPFISAWVIYTRDV